MGLYFLEYGVPPRPIRVMYDRRDSAFARLGPEDVDWGLVRGARVVHLSGITPALGAKSRALFERAVIEAGELSFDLNYRATLWSPADARAFVDGEPSGNLTRDNVLDNITTYWLTGTGASAARSYWEAYGPDAPAAGSQPLPPPPIPVGFTTFPGEIWRTPRSWVEASYPNLIYFNEVDKGGHFAAWEEPELFATEVRAAFGSLR